MFKTVKGSRMQSTVQTQFSLGACLLHLHKADAALGVSDGL